MWLSPFQDLSLLNFQVVLRFVTCLNWYSNLRLRGLQAFLFPSGCGYSLVWSKSKSAPFSSKAPGFQSNLTLLELLCWWSEGGWGGGSSWYDARLPLFFPSSSVIFHESTLLMFLCLWLISGAKNSCF